MAKKTKSPVKAPAGSAPANVEAEAGKKIMELKAEGNRAFATGDYTKALTTYDDAIKLLSANAPERVDFHNNKAACFIGQKRYKEAVKECTAALEVSPASTRALQRRAKAYEQQGLYKQALADVQAINRSEQATVETQEHERRLREAAARKPAAANGGGAAAAASNKLGNVLQQGAYVAKCSLGDESKLVHLSLASNYSDVLAAVQAKFPAAGPFALKYVDKGGDLVTLTCKADLHLALSELVQQYQRQVAGQGSHGPKLTSFPPLRLHLAPVASAADVPQPPPEEEYERQHLMAMHRAQMAAAGHKDAAAPAAPAPVEELHLDSWLVDFAQLFIQQTGLEPDKHVDLHNMGWEKVQKGIESAIQSEEAAPLFSKAQDSFRDVACTGLTSWGQVHQLLGQRALEAAAKAGSPLASVRAAVLAEFEAAEKKYREALSYNAEFFDAVCNMSQLEFERCKLAAGLMPQDPKAAAETTEAAAAEPSTKSQEQAAADQQEALNAATRAVLTTLVAEEVEASRGAYETALGWADKAVALAPAMDAKQKEAAAAKAAEPGQAGAAAAGAPAGDYDFSAQALVLQGNFIYEWSQMLAAVGKEWRPELDRAVALFKQAGCPEKDIRVALRNHFKAAELDIPAEEAPAEEAAAKAEEAPKAEAPKAEAPAPAEEKPKAKGLPSLERKAKK